MQLTAVVVAVVLSAVAASAGNPTMQTFEKIYKIDQLDNTVSNKVNEMIGGSGARRQGANVDQCPQVTCVANGAACPSSELPEYCSNCTDALSNAIGTALAGAFGSFPLNISNGNATAACQAWTDFYACVDAAPTGVSCDALLGTCGGIEEALAPTFSANSPAEINAFFTDCAACAAVSYPPLAYDSCNLFSSYCDNNTLTCMPQYTSGTCDSALDQCGNPAATLFESNSYFCNSSNLCQVSPGSKSVGDNCDGNAVCASNICTAGVCVGKAAGDACTSTGECAYDHFCSNSTNQCTAAIAAAGACASTFSTDDNDWEGVCVTGYECTRATGNCEPFAGVVAAGTTCYFNSECGPGKYCDGSYECAAMPTTAITCDPRAATLPAACTARYQEASCGCDFTTGDNVCVGDSGGFPAGCEPYIQSTVDCMTANQCKDLGSDACRAVCGEELACIGECIAPVYQAQFGSCFDNNLIPTGCPSAAPSPSPAGSSSSDASAFAASAAASVAAAAMVAN